MLTAFLDNVQEAGTISPRRLGLRLHMPVAQLAKIARLHRNSLGRRKITPATQERLGEIASIIAKATAVAGDEAKAIIWFKHQPIPGFRGETAQELVTAGHGHAVLTYLDQLNHGIYA